MIGDDFRDHIAALLRTRYDNVQTEVKLTAKFDVVYGGNLAKQKHATLRGKPERQRRAE
jgi:hypothetical protein